MKVRGKVLYFDENRGRGKIRLDDGREVHFTYRVVDDEGFVILFEGEEVEVEIEDKNTVKRVKRLKG
jgi:cold shock CspA family protein